MKNIKYLSLLEFKRSVASVALFCITRLFTLGIDIKKLSYPKVLLLEGFLFFTISFSIVIELLKKLLAESNLLVNGTKFSDCCELNNNRSPNKLESPSKAAQAILAFMFPLSNVSKPLKLTSTNLLPTPTKPS